MARHNEELKAKIFVTAIGSYVAMLIEEKRLEENYKISEHSEDFCDIVRAKELISVTTFQTYVVT